VSTAAFVGVGSNIEPEKNIVRSLRLLAARVNVVSISTMYRSVPLMGREIPRFVNGVWRIETDMEPAALRSDVLKRIENECGRSQSEDRYGSRVIDLDLLIYGELSLKNESFELPHPDVCARPFVAIPLLELAPRLVLPGTGVTLASIVKAMSRASLEKNEELTELLRKELLHE
jgi:2-amino-4-hydroxy-6-hydroxymethyldihydropteridine diphosphokinase